MINTDSWNASSTNTHESQVFEPKGKGKGMWDQFGKVIGKGKQYGAIL